MNILSKSAFSVAPFMATLFALLCPAHAFLGTDEFDISAFCNKSAPRRTIVYVDDQSISDENTAWAKQIYQKIKSNLIPNEPVQVVQISSANFSAKSIWGACWPDYSPDEKAKLLSSQPWFSKRPSRILESQQNVFLAGVANSLSKIYESRKESRRDDSPGTGGSAASLAKALVADESRIHSANAVTRLIIYSRMDAALGNNSADGGSDVSQLGSNAASKAKFSLDGSSVYLFGVDGGRAEKQANKQEVRDFWSGFVKSAGGFMLGFGAELNLPGSQPIWAVTYDVEVKLEQVRVGLLRIFVDSKGQIQDSSLYFSPEHSSAIEGSFVCSNTDRCNLLAKTLEGTITLSAGEEIHLNGNREVMKGTLGFSDDRIKGDQERRALFELTAKNRQ